MNNPTRPEVEKLITYIEDEFCKRMDIDDFDRFFTELAIALMLSYGPSIPGNFGDNCLTCGLYVESCKEKLAPTRPEAVQEAMEFFSTIEPFPFEPSRLRLNGAGKTLAAYARDLEAERDRLRDERDLNLNLLMVERNLNKELRSELAEARKGRG